MRADRLIAALMVLQAKGTITAAELASELEVSTRTARRDLEALAMSGVPLYSQAGRGGGWRLVGGARTDLTGLSSDEARALFLALGHQRDANPVLQAALRKLVVALPERFRDDAMTASSVIRVDSEGWGKIGSAQPTPFVDELSDAVIAGRQVRLTYTRPNAEPSDRVVHPLGLVTKRSVWYLVANTARGIRTYRVSRVSAVERLDDPVERPPDFDLDQAWASIVSEVGARLSGVEVRASVDPAVMQPLTYIFATRCEVHGELPNGRIDVTLRDATAKPMAAQLAGFGAGVELIDPPAAVAEEMKRIRAELAGLWGTGALSA